MLGGNEPTARFEEALQPSNSSQSLEPHGRRRSVQFIPGTVSVFSVLPVCPPFSLRLVHLQHIQSLNAQRGKKGGKERNELTGAFSADLLTIPCLIILFLDEKKKLVKMTV